MEATSIYSFHPAMFFKKIKTLRNSILTQRWSIPRKRSYNCWTDVFYIADFLRVGRYSTGIVRQENYIALQRLTRSLYELVQSLVRAKQHFIENLYYKLNKLVISNELNT